MCIVSINSDETFTLNEDALAGILKNKEIDDHKVVILSIFGTYRKGKSFVMNFFLRYLQNTVSNNLMTQTKKFFVFAN